MREFTNKIIILSLALLVSNCGSEEVKESTRGSLACNEFNQTGENCEKANFVIDEIPAVMETDVSNKVTWVSTLENVKSYELILATDQLCESVEKTFSDITETSYELIVKIPGEYYLCVIAIAQNDKKFHAINSGKPITFEQQKIAKLSIGDSAAIDFGSRVTGLEVFATVSISNIGIADASEISFSGLENEFLFKGGTFPGTGATCTTTIKLEESCTISISYKAAVKGDYSQEVILSYNNSAKTATTSVTLIGKAITEASLVFTEDPTYDFGDVTVAATGSKVLTLTNNGEVDATYLIFSTMTAPFALASKDCTDTLAAGASCTITIEFTPTQTGIITYAIAVGYINGNGNKTTKLNLEGKGI